MTAASEPKFEIVDGWEQLPAGWSQHVSKSTGRTYWHHHTTGVSTYDRPTA